ncbi:MAG TPA: hypothetical protein VFT80_15650, partial [Actinomycetota bacterium]|nr:hypothetical protein [Actinomycetota bacterium]
MRAPRSGVRLFAIAAVLAIVATACGSDSGDGSNASGGGGDCTPSDQPVLTFAAYSTPREVYG